jgi:dihydroorotase
VGLETAVALTITGLVRPGHLSLERALELWTDAPRRVFGLPRVALEPGSPADLVLLDPAAEWVVEPARFHSKGRNTPFAGRTVTGRVLATWLAGATTHVDPERERRQLGKRSTAGVN